MLWTGPNTVDILDVMSIIYTSVAQRESTDRDMTRHKYSEDREKALTEI